MNRTHSSNSLIVVGFLAFLVAAAGCSNGLVKARGRVVKNDAPLRVDSNHSLEVIFYPYDEGTAYPRDTLAARVNSDGTFINVGKMKEGIKPGKYRISVELKFRGTKDELGGVYSGIKSPIIRDISLSTGEIVVDIGKPPA